MTLQKPEAITPQPDPVPRMAWSMTEFCLSWGISRSLGYKMVREGLLKTFLVGRRRFVDVCEAQKLAARLSGQE